MTCEECRDNADALALGALTAREQREAEQHLASCADCATYFGAATAVAGRLALSVPLVRAPSSLRSSLLAAVSAGSAPPGDAGTGGRFTAGRSQGVDIDDASQRDVSGTAEPRSWWRTTIQIPAVAAVFGALVLLGLASWTGWLQLQVRDLRQPRLASSAIAPAPSLAAVTSTAEADALMLLSSPNTVRAVLGDQTPSGPSGAVFWSPEQRRCVVLARQLAPAATGEEYHVWFRSSDKRWDGGSLIPDARGIAETVVPMDRWQLDSGYTISIVLQTVPDDGSRRPILAGDVQLQAQ